MPKIDVPIVDTQVDTDDPSESAMNLATAVLGVAGFLGVAAAGNYVYNRVTERFGVDGSVDVPGV